MQLDLFSKEQTQNIVNVSSVPQRSPFRYAGGKTWFVPTFRRWIQSAEKRPKVLLEPFAGGGIIGLTAAFEKLADKVIMVELDPDVAAVWEIITSSDYKKLSKKIVGFELNHENAAVIINKTPKSTLDRAFQTILRNRVCHGGILAPGAGLIKNGENGKGLSSRWYPETLAKRINEIGEIRERIQFIQGSAFDIIPEYIDNKQNYVFVDPPYTAAGKKAGRRLYRHHELDHNGLFESFKKAKAQFLFTYDDNTELKDLASKYGYKTALIPMKNTHHAKMEELIIGKNLEWLVSN